MFFWENSTNTAKINKKTKRFSYEKGKPFELAFNLCKFLFCFGGGDRNPTDE